LWPVRPVVSRPNKIEAALRLRQGCARPEWTRRFIRGASRGCKVRARRGFIIDPAADAGPGAIRGRRSGKAEGSSIRGNLKTLPSAAPEDVKAGATRWKRREARLEERSGGATRELQHRQRRRMREAGQPGTPSLAPPEGAETGATWRKHQEARQAERGSGATRRTLPTAALKGWKARGDPKRHRRKAGTCESRGDPVEARRGAVGRAERRGNSRTPAPAAPKDAGSEATRRPIAGTAEERTAWGNPGSRATWAPRQLG
jgi:hypothetical protein